MPRKPKHGSLTELADKAAGFIPQYKRPLLLTLQRSEIRPTLTKLVNLVYGERLDCRLVGKIVAILIKKLNLTRRKHRARD